MLSVLLVIKKGPIETQIECIKGISRFCIGVSPKRKEKIEILVEKSEEFDHGAENRIRNLLFCKGLKFIQEFLIDETFQRFDLKIWCVFGQISKSWLREEVCRYAGIAVHLNSSLRINKDKNCWYYPVLGIHAQDKIDKIYRFLSNLYNDPGAIRVISQQSAEVFQERRSN